MIRLGPVVRLDGGAKSFSLRGLVPETAPSFPERLGESQGNLMLLPSLATGRRTIVVNNLIEGASDDLIWSRCPSGQRDLFSFRRCVYAPLPSAVFCSCLPGHAAMKLQESLRAVMGEKRGRIYQYLNSSGTRKQPDWPPGTMGKRTPLPVNHLSNHHSHQSLTAARAAPC